jgi:hypothetical protein
MRFASCSNRESVSLGLRAARRTRGRVMPHSFAALPPVPTQSLAQLQVSHFFSITYLLLFSLCAAI